jgi:hypothetical protein
MNWYDNTVKAGDTLCDYETGEEYTATADDAAIHNFVNRENPRAPKKIICVSNPINESRALKLFANENNQ